MTENNNVYKTIKNFIKKETLAQVFPCELCEISKNTFFTEHLLETASKLAIVFCFNVCLKKSG